MAPLFYLQVFYKFRILLSTGDIPVKRSYITVLKQQPSMLPGPAVPG